MKFASSAYGWKLLHSWKRFKKGELKNVKPSAGTNNRNCLVEHTGISKNDIFLERWTSGNTFSPGHFAVVDHAKKAVVLAIRGTFHLRDALTDLVGSYEPFKGGYAHKGILEAARHKFTEVKEHLLAAFKTNPDYECVLVGHSLGAGVASLLALIINDGTQSSINSFHSHLQNGM
jgi:hypothetical protein